MCVHACDVHMCCIPVLGINVPCLNLHATQTLKHESARTYTHTHTHTSDVQK